MTPLPRSRRFALAGAALLIAGIAFRSQVAQALVVRGDDYVAVGRPAAALERYRRALGLAPNLEVAADRFVFVSVERHDRAALASALGIANAFLSRNPNDATLLGDRALCYLLQRRFRAARHDFARAAALTGRSQDYVFAGWAAREEGDPRGARALWRSALRSNPHSAARVALAGAAR